MHNTNRICDLASSPWVRSADHRRAVGRRILQNWIPATLPDNVQTWYESDTLGHVSSPTRTRPLRSSILLSAAVGRRSPPFGRLLDAQHE